jgi:hypothetical protein
MRPTSSATPSSGADHLGDVADHLIGHFVDQARRSGASWSDIGRSMGAASRPRRSAPCRRPSRPTSTPPRASAGHPDPKALELTFRQALRLGHNCIGTEHVLLALLDLEDGTGVLAGVGVDRSRAESDVVAAVEAARTAAAAEVTG